MFYACEDSLHRVVVRLRDGIELVIVAASTTSGEPEEGGAHGVDHVVQFIHPLHGSEVWVALYLVHGAGDQKSSADRFP